MPTPSHTRTAPALPVAARMVSFPLAWPTVAKLSLVAVLVWAGIVYAQAYAHHFAVVKDPGFPEWWEWSDQGRYWRAAKAWSEGSLDPSRHWYFAGYPLLGAPFIGWTPGHPFYLVDGACLLLFGWTLWLLGGRLLDNRPLGQIIGAAVFAVTVILTRLAMKSFVEPWSTTPTAAITLGALLLAIRLFDRPRFGRAAACGLTTATIVLFRPTDEVPLALAVAVCTAIALRGRSWREWRRVAAGGLVGAAVPVALATLTYVAVFGFRRSDYLVQSAMTGFEWRLIPLHWVTLFVSPLPAFRDELSLSQVFIWVVPGVAGMVACLLAARGPARLRHALVVGALSLHCLLYLAYRDLHPPGLIRFGNYHYFRWCLPVLGLYAVLLVAAVLRSPRRAVAWGGALAAIFALFSWRMTWRERPAPWLAEARVEGEHRLVLPRPPPSVYDGLFIPAVGGPAQIYLASYPMFVGGRLYHANADFKAFPIDGGMIFTILRPMPAAPTTIDFDPAVRLLPEPPRLLEAHLFWRWPHLLEVVRAYALRWRSSR